tara:strand:- start:2005 stop:2346 length:342 start_codon:yes stop_codon:yes gene_type:complete
MPTPLNVFKTITYDITNTNTVVYTAPTGFTGIVLMAQAANVAATSTESVTFSHFATVASTETELLKGFVIPEADAASLLTGKLIIQDGDSIKAVASANSTFKLTLSVLESLNA